MIVFLHIPKTAGSTLNFVLDNSFGIFGCHTNHTKKKVFDQTDLNIARKLFPGLRSIAGHNIIDPLQLSVPDPFYMTFLREPVARVISQYQDNVISGDYRLTFEEALRDDETFENLHVKLMAGERSLEKAKRFLDRCEFVGLTEKFELSLRVLGRLSPYKLNLKYKRRRVAPVNSIKKTLESDPKMLALAREKNQLDLELYAYAVQQVFPKVCAKAGFKPTDTVASYDHYTSEAHFKFIAFNIYNMLFYRQICKLIYRRRFRSGEIARM